MNLSPTRFLLAAVLAVPSLAAAQPAPPPSRGQLLYETHCIECHSARIHWRDGKKARNWATLRSEVLRWQRAAALGWDEADVLEVTRYLSETVYGFAPPQAAHRGRARRAG